MVKDQNFKVNQLAKTERADAIRNDLRVGVLTVGQIAKKHGVTPAAVSTHLARLQGLSKRHGRRKLIHPRPFWSIRGESAVYAFRTGDELVIDMVDFPMLSSGIITFHQSYNGSFSINFRSADSKKSEPVGRVICKPADGLVVDHINGDRFDNRRSNLRVCTLSENNRNRRSAKLTKAEKTSRFKGVYRLGFRWKAAINFDGVHCDLGTFEQEEEAARTYDMFARKLHGEFACVNFPVGDERGALEPSPTSEKIL